MINTIQDCDVTAITSVLLKDLKKKKLTFSFLHHHFYKTLTSVYLLYTMFYINNIFIFFFKYYFISALFFFLLLLPFLPFSFSLSLCRFLILFLPLLFSSFSHGQINTPSQAPQPSKPTSTTDLRRPTSTYLHCQHRSTCSGDDGNGD